MAGETIAIVDNDQESVQIIAQHLIREGYNILTVSEGNEAITQILTNKPDLILMDIVLPGLDGMEVCQQIRQKVSTPIIFLSYKNTPIDKSIGLAAGGDDYMGKPFHTTELLARIKAQLRRSRMNQLTDKADSIIQHPGLIIDLTRHSVELEHETLHLSPKEFCLLVLLAQSPNTIFSSEELFRALWGTESLGDRRTVMVHISNIRKKLEPCSSICIKTVKGVGYKFCIN